MLLLFSILGKLQNVPIVRFSSAIQIENFYSKNRLSVTTESNSVQFEPPVIYSSHPPFEDGWTWIINPDDDNISLARTPVTCGSQITLFNPVAKLYLSTHQGSNGLEVVPSNLVQGEQSVWTVICDQGKNWVRDQKIQLINTKHNCYLTTSLKYHPKELVNRFNVTCEPLSANSIWAAAEGLYFLGPEDENSNKDTNNFEKEL